MSEWCPGAEVISSSHNGGSMVGGPPRFVVHSYEADPAKVSAAAGARALIKAGNEVHLVFNPLSGDLVQILPASVAGRGLVNLPGGVQTNREGDTCVQVEVIAFAVNPFTRYMTDAGWARWATVMDWVVSHGVHRRWPAGPPPAYPSGSSPRNPTVWTGQSGLFGHSQVPENTHGDPGAVNADRLAQAGEDMPLTTADANLVVDTLMSRMVSTGWHQADGRYHPNDPEPVAVAKMWADSYAGGLMIRHGTADALVAEIVKALPQSVSVISDVDLAAIAKAVADEQARRMTS